MSAEIRQIRTNAEQTLADAFAASQAALPGGREVAAQRAAAFDRFETTGLPHRRMEAWKYTDLRNLMRDARPLAAPPDAAAKARARDAGKVLAGVECRRLVVVDGAFVAELSDLAGLEAGLTIGSMAAALAAGDAAVLEHLGKVVATDDPALALNTALMGDGAVIRIAPGVHIDRPIQLVFVASGDEPVAMFVRSLVVVGKGASLTLIETHEGVDQSPYQVNAALELVVGAGARIDHVKIIAEGPAAQHVATLLADIGAGATFNDFSFTIGGAVIRNQLFVRFSGEGTLAGIRGVNLQAGRQHADTTLMVEHVAGGCQSRQLFKSVLKDDSRAVFQGRITVHPGAQRTDARMMSRALLLSETAEADCKPELVIFADDVQCGHGSTAGALDEELRFYLMARGLPADEAESLLVQAFVGEAVEAIEHAGVKDALMSAAQSWQREQG
jgi:Fe-S cluster assembly protein SufD